MTRWSDTWASGGSRELAQLVRGPGPDADVPLAVRELVDRIGNSRFGTTHRGGYDEEEAASPAVRSPATRSLASCRAWP